MWQPMKEVVGRPVLLDNDDDMFNVREPRQSREAKRDERR
jgi:hypothetical protein